MFAAEKGIELALEEVDILAGQSRPLVKAATGEVVSAEDLGGGVAYLLKRQLATKAPRPLAGDLKRWLSAKN